MRRISKRFIVLALFLFGFPFFTNAVEAITIESVGSQWRGYSLVLSEKDENDQEKIREREERRLEIQQKLEEKRRLRIEAREQKLILKLEGEDGIELELDDEEEFEVQEGTSSGKIKIRADGSQIVVARNRVAARTNFPLSLDTSTNELIVTTPAGIKRVAVLPDVAIRNMLANGFIDVAAAEGETEEDGQEATESADLGEIEEEIELTQTEEGLLVYSIEGYKVQRFLGIFKIRIKRLVYASADTGELVGIQQSPFYTILDNLSI
jgi:hypothetical protein